MIEFIYSFDFSVLDFLQNTIKCDFLDPVMKALSYMGEAGAIWVIASIIMLFFKKTRSLAVMLLCAMLAGYFIGELGMKNLIARPRPFVENPDVVLNISAPYGFSFPSGHSCSSFAAATVIFCQNKRLGAFALVLASFIAFSRLYNYVHFPTDVICGIILGVIIALITAFIFKKTGADKRLSPEN